MKKLIFTLMLMAPMAMMAQPQHQKHQKMNPEQRAVLQAKTLRLHLDLTSAQEEKVKTLLVEQMEAKKSHRENAKAENLSGYERKLYQLDQKLAFKAAMKNILTEAQYENWNQIQAHKKRMAFHRSKDNPRIGGKIQMFLVKPLLFSLGNGFCFFKKSTLINIVEKQNYN
jgi:phage I-like protein